MPVMEKAIRKPMLTDFIAQDPDSDEEDSDEEDNDSEPASDMSVDKW
jgi:hypothetical protein